MQWANKKVEKLNVTCYKACSHATYAPRIENEKKLESFGSSTNVMFPLFSCVCVCVRFISHCRHCCCFFGALLLLFLLYASVCVCVFFLSSFILVLYIFFTPILLTSISFYLLLFVFLFHSNLEVSVCFPPLLLAHLLSLMFAALFCV